MQWADLTELASGHRKRSYGMRDVWIAFNKPYGTIEIGSIVDTRHLPMSKET